MCGLAGKSSVAPIPAQQARELAARFEERLLRRGPDGRGSMHDGEALLVHRRLSIIDLSEAGNQPIWNEDETICVIVNGEIYNFEKLRADLVSSGHKFRSRSDSEVIVHLYEDRGIDGTCRALEGMFALALWDSRKRSLFVARDRLGIKPLAIAEHGRGVTFGSTLPAVLADWDVPRDLRQQALMSLLRWGFVPSPWSAVHAVRRVQPGTWIHIRSGRVVDERRFWRDDPTGEMMSPALMREAIERAVRTHLVADVPIGCLLSSGVDSGVIAALAARTTPAVEAWTASQPGCEQDEYAAAKVVAQHIGMAIHEIPIGEAALDETMFSTVIAGMDEPLAVSSLVGLHGLFHGIGGSRRVALSGDGGDELFAGYDWHVGMPAVPAWAEHRWFRLAAPMLAPLADTTGKIGSLGRVASHVRRHPASVYLDKLRIASNEDLGFSTEPDDPMESKAISAWDRFASAGLTEQMLAVDRATALVDEMLAKVDTASMAYSVEARVPLLADEVVRVAKGLPAAEKRLGDTGKLALRAWFGELGPKQAASWPKRGFNSPVEAWFEGAKGAFLRERAIAGLKQLGVVVPKPSTRVAFAAAVVASWIEQIAKAA